MLVTRCVKTVIKPICTICLKTIDCGQLSFIISTDCRYRCTPHVLRRHSSIIPRVIPLRFVGRPDDLSEARSRAIRNNLFAPAKRKYSKRSARRILTGTQGSVPRVTRLMRSGLRTPCTTVIGERSDADTETRCVDWNVFLVPDREDGATRELTRTA